jgi:hypothetical protein
MRNPDLAAVRGMREDGTLPVVLVWPAKNNNNQASSERNSCTNAM